MDNSRGRHWARNRSEDRATRLSEGYRFLRTWLRSPRAVGAIVPSSEKLAQAIAQEVDFTTPGTVVEIGAGTGSITAQLIANAGAETDIVLVEREAAFCRLLRRRFPRAIVIHGDARRLPTLLQAVNVRPVKAVVSGLPLLSLPPQTSHRIVRRAVDVLEPYGVFLQFTYGLNAPVPMQRARRFGIVGQRSNWVWRNVPPASLWRYRLADVPGAAPGRPSSAGQIAAFSAKD